MTSDNLARLPKTNVTQFNEPTDKDGSDGDSGFGQIIIDIADNGYILTMNGESPAQKVFLFNGVGDNGPQALIQDVIENLGLFGKVKLEK